MTFGLDLDHTNARWVSWTGLRAEPTLRYRLLVRARWCLVALLVGGSACVSRLGPEAPSEVARPDPEALRVELLERDRAFAARSVEAGAAVAFGEFLHGDALQLPDGQHAVDGRAAIVDGLEAAGTGWTLDWTPRHAAISRDGDMGWTWGEWTLRRDDPAVPPRHGKYLNVWRRGEDGRFHVVVDMGNSSPPPGPRPDPG